MSYTNLIRWSGLAALVGGVLLIVSDVLNAVVFSGGHTSEVMATTPWFAVQILGLIAIMFLLLGLVGLYAHQAEQAGTLGLIAFLLAFTGTMMVFGLLWGEPFLGPTIAEQAPEILDTDPSGMLVIGVTLSFALFVIGILLLGLTSLQTQVLPRGAAVLLMLGAVLFFVLSILELPFTVVLLGVAVSWMGYSLRSGINKGTLTRETVMQEPRAT